MRQEVLQCRLCFFLGPVFPKRVGFPVKPAFSYASFVSERRRIPSFSEKTLSMSIRPLESITTLPVALLAKASVPMAKHKPLFIYFVRNSVSTIADRGIEIRWYCSGLDSAGDDSKSSDMSR